MSRAEKSRRLPSPLQPLLNEAMAHHQAGRLQEAEQLYQQILRVDPDHDEALHDLGLLAYRVGKHDRASELIGQAIQRNPRNALYHFNLGVVRHKQSRLDDAVAAYERAVTLNPQHAEAQNNLGNAYRDQGKLDQAVSSYRTALRIKPEYAEAHNNLGVALKEQGRLDDALASYEHALNLNPNHAEAHCNRGIVLKEQRKLDDAIASFQQALRIKPDYAKAHHNLGLTHVWQQRHDLAVLSLRQSADLQHNHGRPIPETSVYKSRLKHDAEQIRYLLDRDRIPRSYASYLEALTQLRERAAREAPTSTRLTIGKSELAGIATSFNRILHYAACPARPQGALNPDLDVDAIEARYHATKPEIMYVDDLLRQEALSSLRQFCLESTIWKKDYENGYIGAFLGEGFVCPLLLQISEELRVRFPGIFKDSLLNQAWAFKYDSELKGLNIHADAAAVNVNFWITPDEANLDPARGGLVVWDKEAPRDWNFKEYNSEKNEPTIRAFLQSAGANAVTIPYRQNRAVIFNSDLFHQTDQFTFKDEYESRRLNVTLLYGNRLTA